MPYLRRSYALAGELEEPVAAELWAAGTLGCEVRELDGGRVRVDAYFRPGTDDPLSGHAGVEPLGGAEEVPDRDWLEPWRRQARPFDLGRGFRVDPREPRETAPEESTARDETSTPPRHLLRLPARAAFGVGSHASTRLAVELVEELPLAGRRVLDVGTGTGVLAFVAEHLGAARAVAFDVDPAAVCAARDNARRNRFTPLLFAGTAAALATGARFDWALVNVLPERITGDLPALASRVGAGFVLSGILEDRGDGVAADMASLGFAETGRAAEDGWVAVRVEREERS